MSDKPGIVERMREAALLRQSRFAARDQAVADIVRDPNGREQVGEIMAIEDGDGAATGAFVVEIHGSGLGDLWYAPVGGRRLTNAWHTKPLAVLHLLGARYGDTGRDGGGAAYAARVLGIRDEPEG